MISDISVVKMSVFFFFFLVEDEFLETISHRKKILKMSDTIMLCIPKENAVFKGIFHPKMKILSSFAHSHVFLNPCDFLLQQCSRCFFSLHTFY